MTKRLITIGMVLAALVPAALPATASAVNNPKLTEAGVSVMVGLSFKMTVANTLTYRTTANGTLVTCTNATMSGTVTANSGGNVEGSITSANFSGTGAANAHNGLNECTGSFGNAFVTVGTPLCLKSTTTMADDEFQVTGECGTGKKVKFIIGSTTSGECEYESTGALTGTSTTGGEKAELTVNNTQAGSGSTKIRGGFLCPSSAEWSVTYTIHNGVSSIFWTLS